MALRRSEEYAQRRRKAAKARNNKQDSKLQLESLEPKVLLAGNTSTEIAQVISVVPQPITRTASGTLTQASNQIVVHFNDVDLLDSSTSAENPLLYQLIHTADTITNTDDTVVTPSSVSYDATSDRAVLSFSSDLSALGDGPFRLRINTLDELPTAEPIEISAAEDAGSSFSTAASATNLLGGRLTGAAVIEASIDPLPFALPFPGSDEEPGMRNLPDQPHFNIEDPADALDGITTVPYNFQAVYGADPSGNPLLNAITPNQRDRAREAFDIYGSLLGVQFFETSSDGFTVATGDVRALVANPSLLPVVPPLESGPGGIVAASGSVNPDELVPTIIMDLAEPWDDSFGGSWYQAAMGEIGRMLGMGVTNEVAGPSVLGNLSSSGSGSNSEAVNASDFSTIGQGSDFGIESERIFPGSAAEVLGQHLHRPDSVDIDLYRFQLASTGQFSAETIAERLPNSSLLDTTLTLFDISGNVISQNDDYFSEDSLIDVELEAGTYFIGVSASGNDAYNPISEDSGLNGTSQGDYQLRLDFRASATQTLLDVNGLGLDGDGDNLPGGVHNFWFEANDANTIYVDKAASGGGSGSLQSPFNNVALALAASNSTRDIVRIVGNGGADGNLNTVSDNLPYEIGFDNFGELPDGGSLDVPRDVTVMIDEGAIFKMRRSFVQVGSSNTNIDRSGSALQILGTPDADVIFTSREDETTGVDNEALSTLPEPGEWGGIIFRNDLNRSDFAFEPTGAPRDHEGRGIFLNHITHADVRYGGGRVTIDSVQEVINPVHLIDARPTIAYNDIVFSANAAISANPDSFEESRFHALDSLGVDYQAIPFTSDYDRVGPDIQGNFLANNTTNALSIRIDTLPGDQLEEMTVAGRWDDTDIVHTVKENLIVGSTPGGPLQSATGALIARTDASLVVDPGIIVKMDGSRIDVELSSQIIAEGTAAKPIVFTSLNDSRFGGVTEVSSNPNPGDWGGIYAGPQSRLSLDHSIVAFAGGLTRVPGSSAAFNAIELQQVQAARVTNSTLENNADGVGGIADPERVGHGTNEAAAIFVRNAQPILVGNTITGTAGTEAGAINIDPNSLDSTLLPDYGTSRGTLERFDEYDNNYGPLIRENVLDNNTINGLVVRPGVTTTELVWEDTDVVHVLFGEIVVPNYFSSGGVRLQSSATESLVVKLYGDDAGFRTTGTPLDIDDRIGGILNVLGQPGRPVVLTSLADDTVGAGSDLNGDLQTDTDGGLLTRPLRSQESGSFQIDLNFGPNIRELPEYVAGVEQAARAWERLFEDPITVTIDVELDDATVATIQDGTLYEATPIFTDVGFDQVVSALQSDARAHESIVDQLPDFQSINVDFPDTPENPFELDENIRLTTANFKALFGGQVGDVAEVASPFDADEATDGFLLVSQGAFDLTGGVGFGPEFFDLDRSDGIQPGRQDFVGAMSAAIGNLLGFTSSVDLSINQLLQPVNDDGNNNNDPPPVVDREVQITPFDLFRLSPGDGSRDFLTAPRALDPDDISHVFFDGGNYDPSDLPEVFGFEQGDIPLRPDGGAPTTYAVPATINNTILGVRPGADERSVEYNISDQDRSVYDLIGWDVVGGAVSGDWRGLEFETLTHDRNVGVSVEFEDANDRDGANNLTAGAQFLGALAPSPVDGDENRRTALEVHGFINSSADVDVYSFDAIPGTEVWLDIDATSQALDSVLELVDANGNTLARSDDSLREGLDGDQERFQAINIFTFPLAKSPFSSIDHYSTNPNDAGMRVLLPGSSPEPQTYHLRVRSAGVTPESQVGLTEGVYQLQIRTQELDEVAGAGVQQADIRYAIDGIRVSGLPRHSPLTGETAEDVTIDDPTAGGTPQRIGNILQSDRGAISINGILEEGDVDYYSFSVDFEANSELSTFQPAEEVNLVVDLDYADGLGRPDLSVFIYEWDIGLNQLGDIVYRGTDTADLDDLPAPGTGSGLEDLSRGSVGPLDPLIGPIPVMEGNYVMAIFPSDTVPLSLTSQFEDQLAANPLARSLPLSLMQRVVDQNFDLDPLNPPELEVPFIDPEGANFVPFNLSDVTLYVSAPGADATDLFTVDPFIGGQETLVGTLDFPQNTNNQGGNFGGGGNQGDGQQNFNIADIALAERQFTQNQGDDGNNNDDEEDDLGRVRERLFGFTVGDTDANSGNYLVINPADASVSGAGADSDETQPGTDGQGGNFGGGNQGGNFGGGQVNEDELEIVDDNLVTLMPNEDMTGTEAADEGVQFEALALLENGRRDLSGFAVGSRNTPALDNVLYNFDHATGWALGDVRDDDTLNGLVEAGTTFGYTAVTEMGVLSTNADKRTFDGEGVPNEDTAIVVPAATDGRALIIDGMTFNITDEDGVSQLYEFDSGEDFLVDAVPDSGDAFRDGDTLTVDGTVYEIETGPTLVVAGDASLVRDGATVAIGDLRPGSPALLIEFDTDGSVLPGRVALDITDLSDSPAIAQGIADLVNAQATFTGSAVANGRRISLLNENQIATGSEGITVDGADGLETDGAIAIHMEEYFNSEQVASILGNAIPELRVVDNRIGLPSDVSFDADIDQDLVLFSQEPDSGVSADAIAIPFEIDFTAEQMAQAISRAVGGQRFANVVTLSQGDGNVFADVPDAIELGGESSGGQITGLEFVNDGRLFAVSDGGGLFVINNFDQPEGAFADYVESSLQLDGVRFSGLTKGPQELEDGRFAEMLFATDSGGNLHAFDLDGIPQNIFANGEASISTGVSGANGLAFSTLDQNLWHITDERNDDVGHGQQPIFDEDEFAELEPADLQMVAVECEHSAQADSFCFGGNSVRFGDTDTDPDTARGFDYPGGAQGTVVSAGVDLSDYTSADQPALYFNYFFVAEETEAFFNEDTGELENPKRDAFRVFVSDDSADAEANRGQWHLLATSDQLPDEDNPEETELPVSAFDFDPEDDVLVDVQQLFNNSWYDLPRVRRNGAPDDVPDTNIGPNGIRDPFPFQDQDTSPFVENSEVEEDDWNAFPELNEENGVWRQVRVDLSDFAGSDALRFRFDFSTAAAFDLGDLGGIEIKGIAGETLQDGDTFSIGGETFEFEIDPTLIVPAGTSIGENETFLVRGSDNAIHEFVLGDNVAEITELPLSQVSAEQLAEATAEIINDADVGISATASGNNVVLGNATVIFVGNESLLEVQAGREGDLIPGVNDGNIPVFVSNDMTAEQVAQALIPAFAEAFTGGNEDVIKSNGNIVKLFGVEVDDIGPLGVADSLVGDEWGAFRNLEDPQFDDNFRGQDNETFIYDFDGDGLLTVDEGGGGVGGGGGDSIEFEARYEGVFIDDIVIGFTSRGEEIEDHRLPYNFDNPDDPPFNEAGRIPNIYTATVDGVDIDDDAQGISAGAYEVEIRTATPGDVIFSQLDRLVPSVSITAPAGTQVFDGRQFVISDGNNIFTFEYNDLAIDEPGESTTGTVAVDYNVSDPDFVVATRIRDAINRLSDVGAFNVNASTADGVTSGEFTTRSSRVNLFGNATVFDGEDTTGIETSISSIESSGNRQRDQGQFIIAESRITDSAGHGIIVDAAERALPSYVFADPNGVEQDAYFTEGDFTPQPGPPRALREANTEGLTTGVVISSNIVAFNGEGAIKFSGDANGFVVTAPTAPRLPFEVASGDQFTITDYNGETNTFQFVDGGGNNNVVVPNGVVPVVFNPDICGDPAMTSRNCNGDIDMADYLSMAIESSELDINVIRIGADLFVEGAANMTGILTNLGLAAPVGRGAVPFGRVVNNTLVGLGGQITDDRIDRVNSIDPNADTELFRIVDDFQDIGIEVGDNASPTLLNNVVVNFETGLEVDFSSLTTVREGFVFQSNTTTTENVNVGDFAILLNEGDPLFVDLENGNFYPATGSQIIDSSIDSIEERPALQSVKSPVGIDLSPILAPTRDALGQLREDDPGVEPPNGQGRNAFKDRGAIDRVDFFGPLAELVTPRDNDAIGVDQNASDTIVSLNPENIPDVFEIRFNDSSQAGDALDGTGIDPSTLTGSSVLLTQDGTALQFGADYTLSFDGTNSVLRVLPTSGVWPAGSTYRLTLSTNTVADLAGNAILDNQPGGGVSFTINTLLGIDFGDAPPSYPLASHGISANFFLGNGVSPETEGQPGADTGDDGVLATGELVRNEANGITVLASAPGFLDAWFDFNADGDWNDEGERVFASVSLDAGANELSVNVPNTTVSGEIVTRFRFSSTGLSTPGGAAPDGEVEDYVFFVDIGNIWQNPVNPFDVTGDGNVSSLDVLRIIQEINNHRASDEVTSELQIPAIDPNTPQEVGFVDINGDGFVTPRDALIAINAINEGTAAGGIAAAGEPIVIDPIGEILANPVVELSSNSPALRALDAALANDLLDDGFDDEDDLDWIG